MAELPNLTLLSSFTPRGRRRKYSVDQMLKRLSSSFSQLKHKPIPKGVETDNRRLVASSDNSLPEVHVKVNVNGVELEFHLYDIPNPVQEAYFEVGSFKPTDACAVIAASNELANALGFDVEIVTPAGSCWGIDLWATLNYSAKEAAMRQSYERTVKLSRQKLSNWPKACEQATHAWCDRAKTMRPSYKKKMLKNHGGAEGITQTILRNIGAFGRMTAWYEARTGGSHENQAILRVPPWSISVDFSGVPNGQLIL